MNDGSENKQLKISRACKNDLKDFPNHNLFVLRFEKFDGYRRASNRRGTQIKMTVDVKLLTQERRSRGRSSTQGSLDSVKLPFPDEAAYPALFRVEKEKWQ